MMSIPDDRALAVQNRDRLAEIGQIRVKEHLPDDLSILDAIRLVQSNVERWKEMQTYYYCAMMEVETKFKVLDHEFSLQYDRNPIEAIKTRIKSPESLAEKMLRKNLPLSMESMEKNIFDMAGVRVICSFIDDIYMLADSLTRQDDVHVLQTKDYINTPKPSGYRGLHLVIETPIFLHNAKRMMKVEVQFRTIAMDFWASLEHKLRYKKNVAPEIAAEIEAKLSDCSQTVFRLDSEMQTVRDKIEHSIDLDDNSY